MTWFDIWLAGSSVLAVGAILVVALTLAGLLGNSLRIAQDKRRQPLHSETQEGYIVSAVLGLMALLLSFTFALAVDRFDIRRERVLDSANAVGTAYLQTQLLGEPHRARISDILARYVDNAIVLGDAKPGHTAALLAKDDLLLTELWQATAAAFDSIRGIHFSSTYVSSINNLIDMDGARRAARDAHVPSEDFLVLFIYFVVTAGVLGYVLTGFRGRVSAGFLLVLMVMSLLLILDIDRPTLGGIREEQTPMEDLQKSMASWPPTLFDHWRGPVATAPAQEPRLP
jgi:hypothetical protein